MATDYAASVQGVALRVTQLDADGTLGNKSITTTKFIRVSFTPEYEAGDEVTEKAADGTICVTFKAPDTLKRCNMEIAICEPDPDITSLLGGGVLLTDAIDDSTMGWASPQVGEDPTPNGVAVEVWSRAIVDGKAAATNPYFYWIFPYVRTRQSGDRVIENGLLANTFEGQGLGNTWFANGPDGRWEWPSATGRPYAYARTDWAPSAGTSINYYVAPGDVLTNSSITASDVTNAAKLAGLGYIANPTTRWTVGQKVTISGFDFHWTGTAWASGASVGS